MQNRRFGNCSTSEELKRQVCIVCNVRDSKPRKADVQLRTPGVALIIFHGNRIGRYKTREITHALMPDHTFPPQLLSREKFTCSELKFIDSSYRKNLMNGISKLEREIVATCITVIIHYIFVFLIY